MKVPGLGCLKGCLFTLVILVVASWLVWELSPLRDWIGTGRGYWDEVSHWFSRAGDLLGKLGN